MLAGRALTKTSIPRDSLDFPLPTSPAPLGSATPAPDLLRTADRRGQQQHTGNKQPRELDQINLMQKPSSPDLRLPRGVPWSFTEAAEPTQTFISAGLKPNQLLCSPHESRIIPRGPGICAKATGDIQNRKKKKMIFQTTVVTRLKANFPLDGSTHLPVLLA